MGNHLTRDIFSKNKTKQVIPKKTLQAIHGHLHHYNDKEANAFEADSNFMTEQNDTQIESKIENSNVTFSLLDFLASMQGVSLSFYNWQEGIL